MKLKLYSVGDRYAFCVGGFSSLHHAFLMPSVQSTYSYAWEAYKNARMVGLKSSYHIAPIRNKKYAVEDLTEPLVFDASGEEMIQDHYYEVIAILNGRAEEAKGKGDKKKQDMVYEETKGVVTELLSVKEKSEGEKNKKKISVLISKLKELVKKYFPKQLAKDVAEKIKESEVPPTPPPTVPQSPDQQPNAGSLSTTPEIAPPADDGSGNLSAIVDSVFMKTSILNLDIAKETMEEYGDRICKVIQDKHPRAICKINHSNSTINIIESDNNSTILKIGVNKNLNVDKIIPCGKLAELFPLSSLEFYQRYWKPIVEGVGHFLVEDTPILLSASDTVFPDIPKICPCAHRIKGWNINSKNNDSVVLWFRGKDPTWDFEKPDPLSIKKEAQTERKNYTEEDFIKDSPKRVKCIDEKLQSIYGKVGEVVQVIPLENRVLIDINFGRSVVRLSGDQVDIVNNV